MNTLNKEQILKILEKYNLDKNEYILISGSSMVMHGVKEYTRDIDLSVSEKLYEYLITNYKCTLEFHDEETNENVYFVDNFLSFSRNFYKDCKYEIINSIKCQTLEDIIRLKKKFNRQKDIEDIKLIEKFI